MTIGRVWVLAVCAACCLQAASDGPADVSAPLNSLLVHKQAELRLGSAGSKAGREPKAARLADVGEIAIVDDGDGVGLPAFPFDLSGRTVEIRPLDAGATAYSYRTLEGGYDADAAAAGAFVELGDDDALELELSFPFPLYGEVWNEVYLHSDGNLAFGAADVGTGARDAARAVSGPPRILPFFWDLDPSQPGSAVRVTPAGDRWTATWINVPEWTAAGPGRLQTFQATLYADGGVDLAYGDISIDFGIAGMASGRDLAQSVLVDFSEPSTEPLQAAFVELFLPADIDLSALTQKFYLDHQDAYDVVVVLHNYEIPVDIGAFAFYRGIRNFVQGIGPAPLGFEDQNLFDFGSLFGSPTRLRGLIYMGELEKYPADPAARIDRGEGVGVATTLAILAHELGHRWLANVLFVDPGSRLLSLELLGRQLAHWSWFFNSEASFMEGNRIVDHGGGASPFRFETVEAATGFSPLDLYLMGLEPPESVPPSFVVRRPDIASPSFSRARQPLAGVLFDGERQDVLIDDILAAMGRRTPDHRISQRNFRVGFILLVEEGAAAPAEDIAKVDRIRSEIETYFEEKTGGRIGLETELVRQLILTTWPAAGVLEGEALEVSVFTPEPLDEDLTVRLQAPGGLLDLPDEVAVPAGETFATFSIEGVRAGVEQLSAEAGERFETAHSNIRVLGNRGELSLERLLVLEVLFGDPRERLKTGPVGRPLPYSILVQASDENGLAYGGVELRALGSGDGFATPESAATDAFGFAVFDWTLAGEPGPNTLEITVVGSDGPRLHIDAVGVIEPNRRRSPRRDLFR